MNDLMAHRPGFEESMAMFTLRDDTSLTLADALAENPPARVMAPGTRTAYSNWGTALAAQVVSDVAGVPYATFLNERILEPLAMRRTTLDGPSVMPEPLRNDIAVGYILRQKLPYRSDYMQIGPFAPVGAMASTADDMARWMRFHLNEGEVDGVRLMKRNTHRLMWTRAFNDRPQASDMAHGFMSQTHGGYLLIGHGGATGTFLTYMALIPQLGIGVYVSQNGAPAPRLSFDIGPLVVDHVTDRNAALPRWSDEPRAPRRRSQALSRKVFGEPSGVYVLSPARHSHAGGADRPRRQRPTPIHLADRNPAPPPRSPGRQIRSKTVPAIGSFSGAMNRARSPMSPTRWAP